VGIVADLAAAGVLDGRLDGAHGAVSIFLDKRDLLNWDAASHGLADDGVPAARGHRGTIVILTASGQWTVFRDPVARPRAPIGGG
jgi:hypothetical protein